MNTRLTIKKLLKGALAIVLLLSLSAIFSCEKTPKPTPPAPQPAKYTIKGVVESQQDNSPIAGVTVTMGSLTATTTAAGAFEFANLTEAGKYTLKFTKEGYFDATYSLEFQTASPNHVVTFDISVTMVPYVEGITPIDFQTGGTIEIEGETPVILNIPPATTVTDKNNNPVTGPINITAVTTPDIISGPVNNPGVVVLRLEPSGLQFSNPLPLVIENSLSALHFTDVHLEYFDEGQASWVIQPQAVTYNSSEKSYNTSINHFSLYKVAFETTRSTLGALEEAIDVVDSPILNETLVPISVASISVKQKEGYLFATPLSTIIAEAGVTGDDATQLKRVIEEAIKPYYGNRTAVASFGEATKAITVERVVQPNYKLVTTATQSIERARFSLNITTSQGVKPIVIEVHSAGTVTLMLQDISLDDHSHGHGGGGSN